MWKDLPWPVVIAHRGDKAHAPENTLAAFSLAAETGADAIEFDVKLTADGQVVVLHDQTVDRTTNGSGNIANLPLAKAQNLDAGAWFGEQFRGESIPTLESVFKAVGHRLYLNIELTNYATPGDDLVLKVVQLVKEHNLQERILFSSFFPKNLNKARLLLPEVPCGLLTMPGILGLWGRAYGWRTYCYSLHPNLVDARPALVRRVHTKGKRIHVWTVNRAEDFRKLSELGVDGIFTDDPGMLLHFLGRSK
jgi:glycerophosphoryl diester phosphodiesterase